MGVFFSSRWFAPKDDPNLDTVCEATGLTARQKKAIRDTWEIVKKDAKGNAIDLFIKFFTVHPDYQKLFKSFADIPLTELKQNKRLEAHATTVIYALTSLIDNLDDPECLTEILLKTTGNHSKRGITQKQFEDLNVVVLSFLEEKLPANKFTPSTKEAWSKLLEVVNTIVAKGLASDDTKAINGT